MVFRECKVKGVAENIWTAEGGRGRRPGKTAHWGTS
jgi:hypothetical protein